MGKGMLKIGKRPDTTMVRISKSIRALADKNLLELDSFQIEKLSKRLYYSEELKMYSLKKSKSNEYPLVRLEPWLLNEVKKKNFY